MARSNIFSPIPLDFWAQVYNLDLYRFNQVAVTDEEDECDPLWCQYAPGYGPQGRYHIREALAAALLQAALRMEEKLGSPVIREWVSDEVAWDCANTGIVRTKRYRVVRFGQPLWTQVGTYTPAYAGNVGQVTVPPADYSGDLGELWLIATGYPSSDVEVLKTYSIRPVRWHRTAAGNNVARAHKAQFVDPALWESCDALDDEAATYLGTNEVEVWQQTVGTGESYPAAEIVLLSTTCGAFCAESEEVSCAAVEGLLDRRGGSARATVWPASYDADTGQWSTICIPCGYEPVRVRLYYEAGVRPRVDPFHEGYDRALAEAVARLATAYLPHQPCGCEAVEEMFKHDRMWMAADGTPRSSPADPHAYLNPFGNTWAAQNALAVVRSIRPNMLVMGGKA